MDKETTQLLQEMQQLVEQRREQTQRWQALEDYAACNLMQWEISHCQWLSNKEGE